VQLVVLTPEEYYDPLNPGDRYDGVPQFDHAVDYLDEAIEELEQSRW